VDIGAVIAYNRGDGPAVPRANQARRNKMAKKRLKKPKKLAATKAPTVVKFR